ncbi:MAG: GMC family oxidoreductase [Gammaproteobacteria bacterium]
MSASHRDYDAIVVGSGAGGGMAAYVLTARGLRVLLLEAGRHYDPRTQTPMLVTQADAPLRGASTPDKPFGFFDATVDGGWSVPGEPFTLADGAPFKWWRARMLGGRTNHWSCQSLRFGPYDFKERTRLGLGADWPIDYADLAPYYERVERLIGVFGAAEGIENSPDSPPGVLLPPPEPRAGELFTKRIMESRFGVPVVPVHAAILTRPMANRSACINATPCLWGCSIGAKFQTPTSLLPPALATGRLEVRTDAVVCEINLDARARASGVTYIDAKTGAHVRVRARSVVLAASACESARLLLNSRSSAFPDGLANSSGQVGRNLTDTVATSVLADVPTLAELPVVNEDATSVGHVYAPWWAHKEQAQGRLAFPTGYHISITTGRRMPWLEDAFVNVPGAAPVYGAELRARVRRSYGGSISLASRGGMIPNASCYCELDPLVRDRWGLPVLKFHWRWQEPELAQARHANRFLRDVVSAMGGTLLAGGGEGEPTLTAGGEMIHEVGTLRMGVKPGSSVLNAEGHAWDVRNLYVTDGGAFASHPEKNPTLTILALAWRASEHLAASLLRKEIR